MPGLLLNVELPEPAREFVIECSTETDFPPAAVLLPVAELAFILASTDDWELGRRVIPGLECLFAALDAVYFLPVGVDFFSPFTGDFAGRRICMPVAAVLPEDVSLSLAASSSESCGETNLAVGRGPDVEGPRDFFRIGCGGGGREDDDAMVSLFVCFSAAGLLGTSTGFWLTSVCDFVPYPALSTCS